MVVVVRFQDGVRADHHPRRGQGVGDVLLAHGERRGEPIVVPGRTEAGFGEALAGAGHL